MSENSWSAKGINRRVVQYVNGLDDLTGKKVLDIPCGDGKISRLFQAKGATVWALDLFPDVARASQLEAHYADMCETLPLADESVDFVLCQEGIEHIPDQLFLLSEFHRVLKPHGELILTTPSYSHLRARLSRFFLETDYWKRMPPTEVDAIWFSDAQNNKVYYGHLFLMGVHQLQTFSRMVGFDVQQRMPSDIGRTSLFLTALLYPVMCLVTLVSFLFSRSRSRHVEPSLKSQILWEHVRLNLSPRTLVCKHIFWVMRKYRSEADNFDYLRAFSSQERRAA